MNSKLHLSGLVSGLCSFPKHMTFKSICCRYLFLRLATIYFVLHWSNFLSCFKAKICQVLPIAVWVSSCCYIDTYLCLSVVFGVFHRYNQRNGNYSLLLLVTKWLEIQARDFCTVLCSKCTQTNHLFTHAYHFSYCAINKSVGPEILPVWAKS